MNQYPLQLNKEQVQQVGELAAQLTPISDVAILLDVDEIGLRELLHDKENAAATAYYKSKAQATLELRKQEILLAKNGSPMSMQKVSEYLSNMDTDE